MCGAHTLLQPISANVELTFLNVSHNQLSKPTGVEELSKLEVLNMAHNKIRELKGIQKLKQLKVSSRVEWPLSSSDRLSSSITI